MSEQPNAITNKPSLEQLKSRIAELIKKFESRARNSYEPRSKNNFENIVKKLQQVLDNPDLLANVLEKINTSATREQIMQDVNNTIEGRNQQKLKELRAQREFNQTFPINQDNFGLQTNQELTINKGNGNFLLPEFNPEYFYGILNILNILGYYNPETKSFSEDFQYWRGKNDSTTARELSYTIIHLQNHNALILDAFKTGNRGFVIDLNNIELDKTNLDRLVEQIYNYNKDELAELQGVTSWIHASSWQDRVLGLVTNDAPQIDSGIQVQDVELENTAPKKEYIKLSSEEISNYFEEIIEIIKATKKAPSKESKDLETIRLKGMWYDWRDNGYYKSLPTDIQTQLEACREIVNNTKKAEEQRIIDDFEKIIRIIRDTGKPPTVSDKNPDIVKLAKLLKVWKLGESYKFLPEEVQKELKLWRSRLED